MIAAGVQQQLELRSTSSNPRCIDDHCLWQR
jgi:hypothetical protein